jgi:hypothetical protein
LLERIEQKSTSKVLYCRCNGSSPHCDLPPWISHFPWSPCNTTYETLNTKCKRNTCEIAFIKKALINRAFDDFGGRDGTRTRLGSAEMTGI